MAYEVVIREAAEDDLDHIFAWIAKDNPRAALNVVARIRERITRLQLDALVHTGRPGLVAGTRELVEYPYIIVYKVFDELREVLVLSIIHGARDREGGG
jgi:toxin ParE1/3/4